MDSKKWYESITIWGALLAALAGILPAFGLAEQAAVVAEESGGIAQWIVSAIALVGAALAFIGRLRASKKIG